MNDELGVFGRRSIDLEQPSGLICPNQHDEVGPPGPPATFHRFTCHLSG